jgi:general stress protein YciG
MAGTLSGGRKAASTNKKLHGDDFYKRIGQKGGRNGCTGGFFARPELAKAAGAKGGRKSIRYKNGYKKVKMDEKYIYYIRKADGITVKLRHIDGRPVRGKL